jgi:hypothetical protein
MPENVVTDLYLSLLRIFLLTVLEYSGQDSLYYFQYVLINIWYISLFSSILIFSTPFRPGARGIMPL